MPKPRLSLVLLLLAAPLSSQEPPEAAPEAVAKVDVDKQETELRQLAVRSLLAFARDAAGNKAGSQAKAAYELVLERYDADNRDARTALGFRKEKGAWQEVPEDKRPKWRDRADRSQRERVAAAWEQLAKKLGGLHRALGLQLLAQDEAARGREQLECAITFDPMDAEAHAALGHERHKDFFGTATQVAFLQRLAAIEQQARELADFDSKPEALPPSALPAELASTGLTFTGAKTAHLTIWATSPQEHTMDIAQWGERAVLMLDFLLGDSANTYRVGASVRQLRYIGMMHSIAERDAFIDKNPDVFGERDLSIVREFAGWTVRVAGGRAHVGWVHEGQDFDKIVAHVTRHGFSQRANDAFGEGLVHAMTWLLQGTTYTWYGSVPSTVSQYSQRLVHDPDTWLERLRESIDRHEDWPLQQIPRERLESFRPEVRIKVWYFVVWLVARYPEQWAHLMRAFPTKKDGMLMPEQATAILEQELGAKLPDIEAEWREWAAGLSAIAKASGHGR